MRTKDITNVTQHRDHLRDHLNQVKETGRPLFITNKSGETEAVMMAAATFDELSEKAALMDSLTMIDRSMEDIKAGRTHDAKQAIRMIAAELGLRLNR